MKKIIGLTGPIGSGKSTVSKIFKKKGACVIDADEVAREVVEKDQPALQELIKRFGDSIIKEDGSLNRRVLGKIVFGDEQNRRDLNQIVHPYIIEKIERGVIRFLNDPSYMILVIDAALLFETGLHQKVDQVWYVDADEEIRVRRIIDRDDISYEDALARIKAQPGQDANKERADFIIKNGENLEVLTQKVENYIDNLNSTNWEVF